MEGLKRIRAFLERLSRPVIFALGLAILVAIWLLDRTLSFRETLLLLCTVPVLLVARFSGLVPSLLVSAAAGAGWLLSDLFQTPFETSADLHLWNALVRTAIFALLAVLEVSRERLLRKERVCSKSDSLTGIDNGRGFRERASAEIARAGRTGAPLTAAYLDLDDFKACNDRSGHSAGDGILCAVAGVLKAVTRESDAVARIGGDEFALLLTDAGHQESEAVLGRLREDLEFLATKANWPIGFSIGAVVFARPPESVDALLHAADRAMYRAKIAGKGCTVVLED
jgi:diguanylate cyclase (GGDEF)-like protein